MKMNRIEHSTSEGLCYLSYWIDAGFNNINRSHFLFSLVASAEDANEVTFFERESRIPHERANVRWIELKFHSFRTNSALLEFLRKRGLQSEITIRGGSYCSSLTLPLLPSSHSSPTVHPLCFSFLFYFCNKIKI